MVVCFLDASALVKLYVREPGTAALLELAGREGHQLALLALSRVECRAALRRRQRTGEFPAKEIDGLLDRLDQDLEDLFAVQPVQEEVLETACDLLDKHSLRAYDAMQLAAGLRLKRTFGDETFLFVCSDKELLAAASAEGLESLDPRVA